MTSDIGRLNVVASFPDLKHARAAIDSLQFGGFDPLSISLLGKGAREAEHELNTRTNTTRFDGGIGGRLIGRFAVGALAGGVAGMLFGLVLASFNWTFVYALDSHVVQMASWAWFGFIAGGFFGAMTGISQGEAWNLTYSADGNVSNEILVAVHSDDEGQIQHADKLLRKEIPISIERFTGDAPPPAVSKHIHRLSA